MYSIKSALRRSLSRLSARSVLPLCWSWPSPCPPVPPARSPGQEGSAGSQGPAAASAGGWRGAAPPGNLAALPPRASSRAAAAWQGRAARGRDCRAAERNQSREEANNLPWPLRGRSAALLQALRVSLGSWGALGEDESLKRGSFSHRKRLFQGTVCRVRAKVPNADGHSGQTSEKVQACCSTALTCTKGHPSSVG